VKARKFYDQGIRSVVDLKSHQSLLNSGQKIGLKYMDDFNKKIPRDEVAAIFERIREVVEKLDPGYIVTACGSLAWIFSRTASPERELPVLYIITGISMSYLLIAFRRGAAFSNDLDVLLSHKDFRAEKEFFQFRERSC
jgi:Fingers domain of DNA polymerase lambda